MTTAPSTIAGDDAELIMDAMRELQQDSKTVSSKVLDELEAQVIAEVQSGTVSDGLRDRILGLLKNEYAAESEDIEEGARLAEAMEMPIRPDADEEADLAAIDAQTAAAQQAELAAATAEFDQMKAKLLNDKATAEREEHQAEGTMLKAAADAEADAVRRSLQNGPEYPIAA